MPASESVVGKPINRVDGRLKVTGKANYAADHPIEHPAFAVLVLSSIGKGTIEKINARPALQALGVLGVISHENAPKLHPQLPKKRAGVDPAVGQALPPLQDNVVRFHGQPIAVVIADTFEQATHAASLLQVVYQEQPAVTEFKKAAAQAVPPSKPKSHDEPGPEPRGNFDQAFANAEVRVSETYVMSAENHNPMEPHATVAAWNGDKLTLHDKTQWINNVQEQVGRAFGIPPTDIHVIAPFVGGAFGSALRVWPHVLIAAMSAKQVKRPVKLILTRAQLFTIIGYRPAAIQKLSLGAIPDGTLTALRHEGIGQTSVYEEFPESLLTCTQKMYACPNLSTDYKLAPMNVNTPTPMRGPGEASGMYALESAMDELAVALKMDPVALRLKNHADRDPEVNLPWSSKSLKECYRLGAKRFGWERWKAQPRATRKGTSLVGFGMASATWGTHRQAANVRIRLQEDGSAVVQTAAHDIGPGTYTSITQVAADALGLPMDRIHVEIGDSNYPKSPVQGGSMTMASVGSAVLEAAELLKKKIIDAARTDPSSPLRDVPADEIVARDGRLESRTKPNQHESYADLIRRQPQKTWEVLHESKPSSEKKFSSQAFGAHFVEVHVDVDLGVIRIPRVVSVFAAGKIINPKTAHSQAIGGIVGGIGMALFEAVHWDTRNGRVVNSNLADYHVPVNADIHSLDVAFVEETDPHVNPLGVKGLAELSIVGVAAAIANAVYNATGIRIRDLPITPDKLLT